MNPNQVFYRLDSTYPNDCETRNCTIFYQNFSGRELEELFKAIGFTKEKSTKKFQQALDWFPEFCNGFKDEDAS
jgi:hypothetical protein